MIAAAAETTPAALVLPGLPALLQQAAEAAGVFVAEAKIDVKARVSSGGRIDRVLADVEQHAVHGFGWYASYAELMNQVAGWAARLEAEGAFGETEALLAQLLFAEYCTQLIGGIPMNQGEMVRPADLTASRDVMNRLFAPALVQLMTPGGGQAVKTRLADLVAAARGKATVEACVIGGGLAESAFVIAELVRPNAVIATHVNEVATKDGKLVPGTKTEQFIKRVGIPAHIPLSGKTMTFDGSGKCVAGC